jgi:hypothetical protein
VPQVKRAEDGTVQYDFTRQEQLAALRRRYGLTGPVPVLSDWARVQQLLGREGEGLGQLIKDEAFRREYVALVQAMLSAAQQRGERLLFYPVDEPAAAPEVLNPIQRLLALAQQSGAQTFVTVREHEGKELGPWLDATCWGLGSVNERSLAATRAAGKPLYCYSGGYGLNPAQVRVQSGFYYWKIDARWLGFWVYCWPKGDPWFDLDNDMRETGFVFPGEEGPVPTIQYEALREGIDDLKYLYTLDQLVGCAARHPDPAARRAATDAAMLVADQLAQLPFDGSELGAAVEALPPETWDAWREAVAAQIVRLREVLGN